MPRRLQSILALLAGLVLITSPSIVLDVTIRAAVLARLPAAHPYLWSCSNVFCLGYNFVFTVLGSYVTARFAPRRPMRHVIELGIFDLLLNLIIIGLLWHRRPWDLIAPMLRYFLTTYVINLPALWLGGTVRERQLSPA